ncbi:MAG: 4-hydroxy-tetrahydrodipicolinate reductase, partial [Burkholderiaceae bacterium]
GQMLIEAALADPSIELTVALDRPESPAIGRDCGEFLGRATGVRVESDLSALARSEVLIDFTRPEATLAHLAACTKAGVRMVIGTTGLDANGKSAIRAAAERIAIVFAPNMSVGVTATLKLIEMAARALGDEFDIEIIETHHRHKVDAPSGTALKMGEVVAAARGVTLEDKAVYSRVGETGERARGAIGLAAVRGGDIIGDHTVLFAGAGERIEITHRASSRATYAAGGLRAARFIASQHAGIYDMNDVLGLG